MTKFTQSLAKMNYAQLDTIRTTVEKSIHMTAMYGDINLIPELREQYTIVLSYMNDMEDGWDIVENAWQQFTHLI